MALQHLHTWILPFLLLHTLHQVMSQITIPNMTSLGCHTYSCYFYSDIPASWDDARDACSVYNNTFLVTVRDNEERTFLHRAASHRGPGLWLGAQQKVGNWTWLSDYTYHGEIHEFKNRAQSNKAHCGVINTNNKEKLEGSPCYETKRYVCAAPNAEKDRTSKYFVSQQTERLTWFQARQDCLSRGMDLASGTGNSSVFLYQLLFNEEGGNFWIGLRKSRFIWDKDGMELTYAHFKAGEPNYIAELCLEMSQMGEYNDETCDKVMPYVCEWVNTTSRPIIISLDALDTFLSVTGLVMGLTVGGIFLVLLITTLCIVLLLKKLKKEKEKRRTAPEFPAGNLYDNTIQKPQHGDTEIVYDVTNQFHFIQNDPVPLAKQHKKSSDKKPAFKKFSLFSSKKKEKEKSGFDTLDSPYENESQENLYQNAQAALPHYQNLGTDK